MERIVAQVAYAGLVTGVVEWIVATLMYMAYRRNKVEPLMLMAIGVALLGVGQVLCKFILRFLIGIQFPLGVPFKTAGIALLFAGITRAFYPEKKRLYDAINVVLALYFLVGSYYSMLVLHTVSQPLLFQFSHFLFLLALPAFIAYIMLIGYLEAGDLSMLFIGLAFLLYAVATFVGQTLAMMGVVSGMAFMVPAMIIRAISMALLALGSYYMMKVQ